jgi:hypothetical protein
MDLTETLCERCGLPIAIGQWPCISTIRPHGTSVQTTPFAEYFDFALGRSVTSLGDRWQGMKAEKLTYRDKVSRGDLSARRDRIEEGKKARRG